MKKLFLSLNIISVLFSCTRKDDFGFRVYKIKEGKHSSSHVVCSFSGDEMSFEAMFNETVVYENLDPVNQEDINKLFGFSDCSSHHQNNSARFGWRWFNNEIQIFAYCYAENERAWRQVGVVEMNESNNYRIVAEEQEYIFWLNEDSVQMKRGKCDGNGGLKYKLYPYFGGDETAPHEVQIMIKD